MTGNDTGLMYDAYNLSTNTFIPYKWNTVTARGVGRPMNDDSMFLRGSQLPSANAPTEAKMRSAFYSVLDRLVATEGPPGNWGGYVPCSGINGTMHPRQAFWWGLPFFHAYADTKNKTYLAVAKRSGMWYMRAQRKDGGMFRSTDAQFLTSTFGQVTSGSACAAILWLELYQITKEQALLPYIYRALSFVELSHIKTSSDPNMKFGTVEDSVGPNKCDANPYRLRDIATSFYVQALAKLLEGAAQEFPKPALKSDDVFVYPATPRALIDRRLTALVGGQTYPLEVQNAQARPLTRGPGYGRPQLPSSRLQLATSSDVHITLRCAGSGMFLNVSDLRGVGFSASFHQTPSSTLSFSLPAPTASHPSAHYYLKSDIVGGPGSLPGVNASQLFLFWLDLPTAPAVNRVDVTTLGVVVSASKVQTAAIQRAINQAARKRVTLFFPLGYYRTGVLFIPSNSRLELAPGALLQMPAPSDPDFVQPVGKSTGCPSDFAFIEIQNATNVSIMGAGATIDAHGFPGHAMCVFNSSRVNVSSVLMRQPASWNTHIFRSASVRMTGVKLFSGADGFDPDCSKDVTIDSVFVHSNDDAFAVKVAVKGHDTERITMSRALISTKKSAMKVGTESLASFKEILFADVEAFDIDRGLVLYPSDGGRFDSITWQRIRVSSFLPCHNEPEPENKAGTWLDFSVKHRKGLSQMSNVTIDDVTIEGVCGSATLKGIKGALVQNVEAKNLTLQVVALLLFFAKKKAKPLLISCDGGVETATVRLGLNTTWNSPADKEQWSGVQHQPGCATLKSDDGVTSAAAACPHCAGPVHSWDSLPVSFHSSALATNARGEFSKAELALIARFPLVTIEKWQGVAATDEGGSPVFLWEETAMVNAAKQVKANRPNTSVIVWLDSSNIYTGWVFPPNLTACAHCSVDAAAHNQLVNHTFNADVYAVQGHSQAAEYLEQHPEMLLRNKSGALALGWGNLHVYDHRKAAVRARWRDTCLGLTASGVIDGCGADFSSGVKAKGLEPIVAQEWVAGHATMLRETTAALGAGLLVGKDFDQLGDTVNAILREGCTSSNDTVNAFRNLTALARASGKRYVAQCHFGHPEYVPPLNLTTAQNTAAAFLCGAGENHYFATAGWRAKAGKDHGHYFGDHGNFSTHWLPSIMGRPLGAPLADAEYDATTDVWTRGFASGTVVTFNARTNIGNVIWSDVPSPVKSDDGSAAGVTLFVSPSGSDANSGASKASPLLTCAAAVAKLPALAAKGGLATIRFASGVYPLTTSTACGSVQWNGTATTPLLIAGDTDGDGVRFEAMVPIDASKLKPVSDPKILALVNPSAKGKLLAMPLPKAPSLLEWAGTPLFSSVFPNPNAGTGQAFVRHIFDKGSVWFPGRSKYPQPKTKICKATSSRRSLRRAAATSACSSSRPATGPPSRRRLEAPSQPPVTLTTTGTR